MTREKVRKQLEKDEKMGRRVIGASILNRSPNRGNGKNRNYNPNLTGFSPASTHVVRMENAEGNMALVPITSRVFDRDWTEYHTLAEDERKVRRMKNKQRKLLRSYKHRKKHGRSVKAAS